MSIEMEKKLGFGTMRLPLIDPDNPGSVDLEQFKRMADLYMERGFRYLDTAYPYHEGHSEDAVRQCVVERYPRESFLLADKMPIVQVLTHSFTLIPAMFTASDPVQLLGFDLLCSLTLACGLT